MDFYESLLYNFSEKLRAAVTPSDEEKTVPVGGADGQRRLPDPGGNPGGPGRRAAGRPELFPAY